MPFASYDKVADPKVDKTCKDMKPVSLPTCELMVDIIKKKGSCGPLVKSKAAMKACVKYGGKEGTTAEKIPPVEKLKFPTQAQKDKAAAAEKKRPAPKVKKTQCTKQWADKKAANGDAIDILRICGTKRIREYAKCFDEKHLVKIALNHESCIEAAEAAVKTRAGTNTLGFKCAKEFSKSCFKDLRLLNYDKKHLNYPKYEAEAKAQGAKPTKRDFCKKAWEGRKDEFIGTGKDSKKILLVDNVAKCVIVE